MVVEVADTTLQSDLKKKAAIYARNGVPEYWVVDVNAGMIHQMSKPDGSRYENVRKGMFGEPIEAVTLPGLVVHTDRL